MEIEIEQLPNPDIQASARAFYNASKELQGNSIVNSSIPVIVNAAFSLELYLKSFNSKIQFKDGKESLSGKIIYDIVINKVNNTGHVLSELFSKIKPDISRLIESDYNQQNESFIEALKEFNNVFIEWRYVFEGNGKAVNITKMFRLLNTLENTAIKLENNS